MKKILKIFLAIIVFVLVSLGIAYAIYNEPLPSGKLGPEADALALKMLTAVNYEAYQRTRYLKWTFAGGAHHYLWDKEKGEVKVEWAEYRVLLNIKAPKKSTVYENSASIIGDEKDALIEKAVTYFNNDSFWLVAPFKVFDKGTERSIVTWEDGSKRLLVTYSSGGTTPGDSYLWKLGANGLPESFRMWVSILPIGGLKASWDHWQIMESGVFLSTSRQLGPFTLNMGDVRGYFE